MKKRIAILLLTALLLTSSVCAYTNEQVRTADAMNHLGLFLGTNHGYELDNQLTRVQGVTLLVRMIGKEQAAQQGSFDIPFVDVVPWAAAYVGYAWTNDITKGVSDTRFDPDVGMTDYMFLTLTLRALGYSDSGEDASFVWDDPYAKAQEVGLINRAVRDDDFTRGDAIAIFWNAMSAKLSGSEQTLAESLIQQGVFTAEQYKAAQGIQRDGRKENAGIPLIPGTNTPAVDPGTNPGGTGGSEDKTPDDGTGSEDTEKAPEEYTYEEYLAMSGEEQQAFFARFENAAAFMDWMNEAMAEYNENKGDIEIGSGGSIDLGDLIGGNAP